MGVALSDIASLFAAWECPSAEHHVERLLCMVEGYFVHIVFDQADTPASHLIAGRHGDGIRIEAFAFVLDFPLLEWNQDCLHSHD